MLWEILSYSTSVHSNLSSPNFVSSRRSRCLGGLRSGNGFCDLTLPSASVHATFKLDARWALFNRHQIRTEIRTGKRPRLFYDTSQNRMLRIAQTAFSSYLEPSETRVGPSPDIVVRHHSTSSDVQNDPDVDQICSFDPAGYRLLVVLYAHCISGRLRSVLEASLA